MLLCIMPLLPPFDLKSVKSHIESGADVTQVYYRNKPVSIFVLSRVFD